MKNLRSSTFLLCVLSSGAMAPVGAMEPVESLQGVAPPKGDPDLTLTRSQLERWLRQRETCGEERGESCRQVFRDLLTPSQRSVFDRNVAKSQEAGQ